MPFVEVFLPSGHREKMEISTNTTFITILEDVCIKRGLNFNHCYLNHNKSKIDLSLKFGMSKLINNVKLDLIECPSSLIDDASVEVVMQLPNLVRLNGCFNPKENIYSIMEKFVEEQPQLKTMIFPEAVDMTAIIFHFHDQIVGKYCLQNTTLSSLGLRIGRVLFRLELKVISDENKINYEEIMNAKLEKYLKGEEFRRNKEKNKKILETTDTILSHEVASYNVPTTSVNDEPVSFTNFSPFSVFSSQSKSMLDGNFKEPDQKVQQRSQTLGELLGMNLEHSQEPFNVPFQSNEFQHFKFPEKSKMDDDYENNIQFNDESISNEERESVLYYHNPGQNNDTNEDDSDAFFELTEEDIRSIIKGYRNVAESDSPLMTNALREQIRETKFSKYQRCIIQFKFKDAYILQSVFKPKETVGDLYNYLSNFFKNNGSNFYLYTSPPKDILKAKDKKLTQAGLVPMCKVYVSVKAIDLSNNIDNLLFGDEVKARQIIQKWMKTGNDEGTSSGTNRHVKSNSGNAHKMPKWFKSGT